jgi:hypothetical protein
MLPIISKYQIAGMTVKENLPPKVWELPFLTSFLKYNLALK